ncbi:MAG: hypothetical protein LBQ66_00435 [Planctomycetaceae bacterium]|jgi:ligand-binding sensor domain-containing protein|nr:hypothetical protein [Planctomycetaceae bacterium]
MMTKKPTLEAEPDQEANLNPYQCPRCKHLNQKVVNHWWREIESGVWEGKPYQVTEVARTQCAACGEIFYIKKHNTIEKCK